MPVCARAVRAGIAVLALGLCASACGAVWWKPGAGTAELARDRESCGEGRAERAAFERCMRERGWWSSLFGAPREAAAPPPVASGPAPEPGAAERAAAAASPSPVAESEAGPPTAASEASDDPGVWWRLGGSSLGRLDRDQSECRAEARAGGAAEASGPARWGESPQFDACMRARGWRGG